MANLTFDLGTALKAHADRRTSVRNAITHSDQGKLPAADHTIRQLAILMSCVHPDGSTTLTNGSSAIGELKMVPSSRHYTHTVRYLRNEQRILATQPLTFVSSEICDLINIATSKMGTDIIHESDLIAPEGMIYLARPIYQRDFHPVTGEYDDRSLHAIRAISWHLEDIGLTTDGRTLGKGVVLSMYADEGITRNVVLPSLQRIKDEDGGDINTDLALSGVDHELYVTDIQAWAFGEKWDINPAMNAKQFDTRDDITMTPSTVGDLRKWFLTFMRFCWQELIVPRKPTNNDISRQQRRAFERTTSLKDPISIVYLRRLREDHDEPTTLGHSLTYRVLVRGHWRNQYYPTLGPVNDPMAHRRIWIDPHVKGPEHAPFRDLPKVTAVVR